MSAGGWFLTISTLVLLFAATSVAYANDPLAKPANTEARAHLTAGNRLYRVREFEKAIEEYKAGALKEDTPVFLYNLAQCYRELGRYEDAIWHFERFVGRANPTGEIKESIDEFIARMREELARRATTTAPSEPAQDGRTQDSASASMPSGSHGKEAVLVARAKPWYVDALGWGMAGSGAIGAAVSAGLLLGAKGLDEDANVEPRQAARHMLHEQASDRRLIGTVVGVAGGAVLVAGIVKLAVRPQGPERAVQTSWRVGFTARGLFVGGRF